jgi:hypothetical protein
MINSALLAGGVIDLTWVPDAVRFIMGALSNHYAAYNALQFTQIVIRARGIPPRQFILRTPRHKFSVCTLTIV